MLLLFKYICHKSAGMRFLRLLLFLLVLAMSSNAQVTVNNGVDRPKLVVGLVIDQMRWDYLYRYSYRYGNNGLKRLLSKGFSYNQAYIPYTPAVTAAGHACVYTGSVPALHGIVGNDWIENRTGKKMYCVRDSAVQTVGSSTGYGMMSPKNLLSPTIGDELRLATNFRSRVYGIALKDRGGIIPAGHSANAAFWLDDKTGDWISSTWYMKNLPSWVNEYNRQRKADSMMKQGWNLLYPPDTYLQSTRDENPYEKPVSHEKKVGFPHEYASQIGKNYLSFRQSPFGNTLTLDFAKELMIREGLGKQGQTDMLCLSLSSTDYVTHLFGILAMETEDMYIRLDKDIAGFLDFLDEYAGKDNYLLFLTADHGVSYTPYFLAENRIPAGSLKSSDLAAAINRHLEKQLNLANAVTGIIEYQVYLNHALLDSLKIDKVTVEKEVIKYLMSRDEVVTAFAYDQIGQALLAPDVKDKFLRGYHPLRSGDIQFMFRPFYSDVLSTGAEHGTWYTYDTHIPLIWFGWKVKPGSSQRSVSMADITPTLAAKLNVQMPAAATGKVLHEVAE